MNGEFTRSLYVGQLEFFNEHAPDGIRSFGSSLCMASISLGNYVSSLVGEHGDLNKGHVDRFFCMLAILTAVDFVIYLFCAEWYKAINIDEDSVQA
ncbi:protein NRT1/ PTR FAMILY 7.1-like [Senna tora]|uniref:Protein NRT1/ PTR FAMILY 7.1-like n=1 Tax=Senna tora TaxID=362788 RepID=A0A834WZA0_9FABA|nr:protein NRT1/ PTR FAMILY 7.1-like [Senna tora]